MLTFSVAALSCPWHIHSSYHSGSSLKVPDGCIQDIGSNSDNWLNSYSAIYWRVLIQSARWCLEQQPSLTFPCEVAAGRRAGHVPEAMLQGSSDWAWVPHSLLTSALRPAYSWNWNDLWSWQMYLNIMPIFWINSWGHFPKWCILLTLSLFAGLVNWAMPALKWEPNKSQHPHCCALTYIYIFMCSPYQHIQLCLKHCFS